MSDDTPDPAGPASIADLLGVVPRLVDRTRRQVEIAVAVADVANCLRRRGTGASSPTAAAPAAATDEGPVRPSQDGPAGELGVDAEAVGEASADAREAVDVLSVLAAPTADADDDAEPRGSAGEGAPTAGPSAAPTPAVGDLPIEEYDSLAASQVVPRLATLSPDELEKVRAYERGTRRRQTILNRVAQLLEP